MSPFRAPGASAWDRNACAAEHLRSVLRGPGAAPYQTPRGEHTLDTRRGLPVARCQPLDRVATACTTFALLWQSTTGVGIDRSPARIRPSLCSCRWLAARPASRLALARSPRVPRSPARFAGAPALTSASRRSSGRPSTDPIGAATLTGSLTPPCRSAHAQTCGSRLRGATQTGTRCQLQVASRRGRRARPARGTRGGCPSKCQ